VTRVVLASANRGKVRELSALLAPCGIELLPQGDFGVESVEETGTSFEANALLKARHAAARTGLAALADDSGLEVDALGGRPGVYSARFAGADADDAANNRRLLAELASVDEPRRGARYRCVLALVRSDDDAAPLIARGSWEGRIGHAPAGDGGFGYDPLFVPAGLARTAAQLPAAEKNALSHRGAALRALLTQLAATPL
jgi:XTP/dITP diphosphohydrolase